MYYLSLQFQPNIKIMRERIKPCRVPHWNNQNIDHFSPCTPAGVAYSGGKYTTVKHCFPTLGSDAAEGYHGHFSAVGSVSPSGSEHRKLQGVQCYFHSMLTSASWLKRVQTIHFLKEPLHLKAPNLSQIESNWSWVSLFRRENTTVSFKTVGTLPWFSLSKGHITF